MLHVVHGSESKWTEINKTTVPLSVVESFETEYPVASSEKWYKFGKDQFVVGFEKNQKKMMAVFSASGFLQDENQNMLEDFYDDFDDYWEYGNFD
jgi:hypothetical protein